MLCKATIMGKICKKETKTLKSGTEVTILSIATNKKWSDANGQQQTETTWHSVQCYAKLADIANKYTQVGHIVYIEGEINNKKQETGNGEVKYYYYIACKELKLIPGQKKPDGNEQCSPHIAQPSNDDSIPF